MDMIRNLSRTAAFVQEFFRSTARGNQSDAELFEPTNLPLWMKQSASYGRFWCDSPGGLVQVTLIVPKARLALDQIANLYRVFQRMKSEPALILADGLASKARGVLVRMGIPHVVTDGAIYAPQLGLAYGKPKEVPTERVTKETLSSVGLKLTAAYLLKPKYFQDAPTLTELQQRLEKTGHYKVSVATLSRAFQQLQELELVEASGLGPRKRMQFKKRDEVWERLLRLRVETVVRRVETEYLPLKKQSYVLSGDSALGKLTDLLEPRSLTVAMAISDFRKWSEKRKASPKDEDKAVGNFGEQPTTIELWRESPHFLEEEGCIDSIELVLSLRFHHDERVQQALTQIVERHELSTDLMRIPV